MEEETVNKNAQEQETSAPDSSSEKEVNLDEMSEEELREFVKKEREKNYGLIQRLREKDEKKESKEPENVSEEDEDDIESKVAQILQRKEVEKFSEGTDSWLKSSGFADDLFQDSEESDRLYARVKSEAARLAESEGVKDSSDWQHKLRRAHAAITGRPDALMQQESSESSIASDKSQAAGYRGSSSPKSNPSWSGFTSAEIAVIERTNKRRQEAGQEPLKPQDIIKK